MFTLPAALTPGKRMTPAQCPAQATAGAPQAPVSEPKLVDSTQCVRADVVAERQAAALRDLHELEIMTRRNCRSILTTSGFCKPFDCGTVTTIADALFKRNSIAASCSMSAQRNNPASRACYSSIPPHELPTPKLAAFVRSSLVPCSPIGKKQAPGLQCTACAVLA